MLGLNVNFLVQSPNKIHRYFQLFDEILSNSNEVNENPYERTKKQKLFRLISLVSFVHPVMKR